MSSGRSSVSSAAGAGAHRTPRCCLLSLQKKSLTSIAFLVFYWPISRWWSEFSRPVRDIAATLVLVKWTYSVPSWMDTVSSLGRWGLTRTEWPEWPSLRPSLHCARRSSGMSWAGPRIGSTSFEQKEGRQSDPAPKFNYTYVSSGRHLQLRRTAERSCVGQEDQIEGRKRERKSQRMRNKASGI